MKVWVLEYQNKGYTEEEHQIEGIYTDKNKNQALYDFSELCKRITDEYDNIEEFYMTDKQCYYLCSQGSYKDYYSASAFLYCEDTKLKKRDYVVPSEDELYHTLEMITCGVEEDD